jgi:hypothetical protein
VSGAIGWSRLRTLRGERAGHPCLVAHLHQEGPPAPLDQPRRCGAALDRDPALRIDAHDEQAVGVQDALDLRHGSHFVAHAGRGVESCPLGVGEWLAEVGHRLDDAPNVGDERLQIGERTTRERSPARHQQSAAERMREERGLEDRTDRVAARDVRPAVWWKRHRATL